MLLHSTGESSYGGRLTGVNGARKQTRAVLDDRSSLAQGKAELPLAVFYRDPVAIHESYGVRRLPIKVNEEVQVVTRGCTG